MSGTKPRTFGEKNARKLLDALERAKTLPLGRWLHALAIPDVGAVTARDIAGFHANLPAVADSKILHDIVALAEINDEIVATNPSARGKGDLSKEDREALKPEWEALKQRADALGEKLIAAGVAKKSKAQKSQPRDVTTAIGPVAARATILWFASEDGREALRRLEKHHIAPTSEQPTAATDSPIAGKTFVITGTLSAPRPTFAARIEQLGGKVTGAVSKSTDYLLAGAEAGSKLDRARELDVKILDEAAFEELVGAAPKPTPQENLDLFA